MNTHARIKTIKESAQGDCAQESPRWRRFWPSNWLPSRCSCYATSLAIYVIALGIHMAILPTNGGYAFLTFYPAVGIAALFAALDRPCF